MTERRTKGLVIGKVFGAPVIVQPSTLVMVALIAYLFADAVGETSARSVSIGVVLALGLIVSVFLHELAHAIAARAFRRKVSEIVLTIWGGHTSFEAQNLKPAASAITALAGPTMNVVIFGVTATAAYTTDGLTSAILGNIAWSNLLLAAFNSLPGLPMDGGKVLEALVWAGAKSRDRGTWVAAWAGRIVAVGLVVVTLGWPIVRGGQPNLLDSMIAILVGGMLWSGASAALRFSKAMIRRDSLTAAGLMKVAVGVDYDITVAQALEAARSASAVDVVVLGADGAPAGFFPVSRGTEVPEGERATTSLRAVTSPLPRGAHIAAAAQSDVVIAELRHWWGRTEAWVVLDDERIVGVLRLVDVVAALE